MKQSTVKFIALIFIVILTMAGCGVESQDNSKLTVAVSIGPEAAFVEAVAGDLVNIVTMIPPGGSPSNYQPSPKEMTALSQAEVYFSIGVPTEVSNILPNLSSVNEDLLVVDLAATVNAVYSVRYFDEDHEEDGDHEEHGDHDEDEDHEEDGDHDEEVDHADHDHGGQDPHIWLSPKRVIVMVEAIEQTLIDLDSEHEAIYRQNAEAYIQQLMALDETLESNIHESDLDSFIIMHPSLGYFADDYGLEMIAIEQSGKEASAEHLKRVIDYAREHDIHVILYQEEFDSSQAKTIAEEIEGQVLSYEPLTVNYLEMMYSLGESFKNNLQ
jgi:zinc transport system substrate-binding protein